MSDSKEVESGDGIESHPSDAIGAKLRLNRPHPLIKRTLDIKVEKDPYDYRRQPAWPGVDIRVSKEQKRSALIVLDRLFKALEQREIKPSVTQGNHDRIGTYAVSGRDMVQIYVEEVNKKEPHEPTAKELREKEQHPHLSRIPKYDTVPTGTLTLIPGGIIDLTSEDALAKLINKATEDIIQQLDDERKRREAAEAKSRQEWERQRKDQEEKTRVEALLKAAASFRQYRDMMDYIEEVRRFGQAPDNQRKEGRTFEEWLRWAEWRARHIHPLG